MGRKGDGEGKRGKWGEKGGLRGKAREVGRKGDGEGKRGRWGKLERQGWKEGN